MKRKNKIINRFFGNMASSLIKSGIESLFLSVGSAERINRLPGGVSSGKLKFMIFEQKNNILNFFERLL